MSDSENESSKWSMSELFRSAASWIRSAPKWIRETPRWFSVAIGAIAVGSRLGLVLICVVGGTMGWVSLAMINAAATSALPSSLRAPEDTRQWTSLGQIGDPKKTARIRIQGSKIKSAADVFLVDKPFVDGVNRERSDAVFISGRRYYARIVHPEVLPPRAKDAPSRYPYLMVVEVTHTQTADGSQRVIADVGCWHLPDGEKREEREIRRIPWWRTKSLASAPRFLDVESRGITSEISFPTSPGSLASWVRTYWKSVSEEASHHYRIDGTNLKLSQQQINTALADALEAAMEDEWGDVQTETAVVVLRVFNGVIQLLIIASFWGLVLIVFCRWLTFVLAEQRTQIPLGLPAPAGSLTVGWLRNEIKNASEFGHGHRQTWGVFSASTRIWESTLRAILSRAQMAGLPEFVQSLANQEADRRDNSSFHLRFLLGAMPGLGFLGTVWGIGTALMGTGAVLSDELAKQQSGVSTVALSLGLAFDTTFVALLLTLIATYLATWLSSREQSAIEAVQDETLAELFSKHERFKTIRDDGSQIVHEPIASEPIGIRTPVPDAPPITPVRSEDFGEPEIEITAPMPPTIESNAWLFGFSIRCLLTGGALAAMALICRHLGG
ncbi:MotA/TolQ/ExbB proton channel family protein [Novipirellula sp. SH528]|uniref:MotA/TolQ/ExbB proton channel family protein n=1 Tax=Novipirellula sp. SH528 TaxID=3454466 RepID=UPI003F9ECC74